MSKKKHIPMLSMDDPDFGAKLDFAMNTDGSSSDYENDRNRPYNGQPWTDNGIRGAQEVKGITMRDLKDCLIQAFLVCVDPDIPDQAVLAKKVFEISNDPDIGKGTEYAAKGTWRTQDVYKVDLSKVDPVAVAQNMTCFVEHYMGIYPNTKLDGMPSADDLMDELNAED
jgi:hypothetical protein